MNKAFVREPEDNGQRHCPECGALGVMVRGETLEAQLSVELRRDLSDTAYFCAHPTCPVAYFDGFERRVAVASLPRPIYPKDPDAPMCGCFGVTRDDLEADLEEGGVTRVRRLIERARTAEAHCVTQSPSGQCCVAEVQRYFLRRRAERGGS